MFQNLKKTLLMVGSSALLFAACGDDGGGDGNVTFDAAPAIDATVDSPDAMPDTTFIGTVSVAEVSVTNDEAAALGGVSGAAAVISFTSPMDVIPPDPAFPNNVGACRVTIIDLAGGDDPKSSDGGAVSVTGTLAGDFECAYSATLDGDPNPLPLGYLCSTTDAAAAGAMPTGSSLVPGGPNGTMTLTVTGADFSNISYAGMTIVLAGFAEPQATGKFQVIGNGAAATQLTLLNSKALGALATIPATPGTYQTLVGAGPVALGGYDFLDDGTADVVMTKAAQTDVPALDVTLKANGDGFALLPGAASEVAHAFPASGDATFACADDDLAPTVDTCGFSDPNNTLKGIIVFGETTDVAPAAGSFSDMPNPANKYATFQCSGIGKKSITIPAAAVALINSTGHTRIQTSVTYANAKIEGKTNVVVAHGVLGFTDAPAP